MALGRVGGVAIALLGSACALGCAEGPAARAPRTVTAEAMVRDAGPRPGSAALAPMLVWARDEHGAAWTFHVEPDGGFTARVQGIHVATTRGERIWTERAVETETVSCDFGATTGEPARGGTATRASLAGPDGQEQVVVEPETACDGEHCVNELRHAVTPLASLGPYIFVEESTYAYACGAHGSTAMSFVVWDVEQGRPADVLGSIRGADGLREEARKRLAEDEDQLGGPFGDDPPEITAVLPVVDGKRLRFDAQLTTATCYACSDGSWSSYSRSVRVTTTEPPAALAGYEVLPARVAVFAARHPELAVRGWSQARAQP